jgi:hypothetical protein
MKKYILMLLLAVGVISFVYSQDKQKENDFHFSIQTNPVLLSLELILNGFLYYKMKICLMHIFG